MTRILFISATFPGNIRYCVHGIFKRMGMFIEAMRRSTKLDMLFFVGSHIPLDTRYIQEMEAVLAKQWRADINLSLCHLSEYPQTFMKTFGFAPAVSFLYQPSYYRISQKPQIDFVEKALARNPDLIFAHRLDAMCPLMFTKVISERVYLDLDDVEHRTYFRRLMTPPHYKSKFVGFSHLPALFYGEKKAVRSARKVFVCSANDRAYLSKVMHTRNVVSIPNAVIIPHQHGLSMELNLLFLGAFSYVPNAQAAEYLIQKIWPRILSKEPHAKLLIVGDSPHRIPSFERAPNGVCFMGFVDDLSALYKKVRLACCPVLAGGGTRIKILEAAAHGIPTVSTTIGAEGLQMTPGVHILIGDDPASFAEACISLMKDWQLTQLIGSNALSLVKRFYDRDKILKLIQENMSISLR